MRESDTEANPTYRILRRIRRDLIYSMQTQAVLPRGPYGEWERFGTRRDIELALAEQIARSLRALAPDGRYQYAIFDSEGRMIQDETGRWLEFQDALSVA